MSFGLKGQRVLLQLQQGNGGPPRVPEVVPGRSGTAWDAPLQYSRLQSKDDWLEARVQEVVRYVRGSRYLASQTDGGE